MASLTPPKGALRTWVELYTPLSEAPPEAHLGAAIATISAAIGWKAHIQWAGNAEPCTVSIILEGRSATARKTTVANTAKSLARDAMAPLPDELKQLHVRSIDHTSDRGLLELVAPKDQAQAERWETRSPPGTLLIWDEFGSVLGDPRDNRKGGDWLGRVRTTLMQLANGRHGGLQTGANKSPGARCAVSVIATMTRLELEQRVDSGLLRDGFLGRFALIPHEGRRTYISRPPKWTPAMIEQRKALALWLHEVAQRDYAYGELFDLMNDEAGQVRDEWYEATARRLDDQAEKQPSDITIAASEAFGRLQTTALKIAMVAAVASDTRGSKITAEHIRYGQHIAEICLSEIISIATSGGDPIRDQYAQLVLKFLKANGATPRSILLDKTRQSQLDRTQRWSVIENLYQEDQIVVALKQTTGRPVQMIALAEKPQNGHISAIKPVPANQFAESES